MLKLIYIFSGIILISIPIFFFYPMSQFPGPAGPYGVGQVKYHWIDSSRKEINTDDPNHPNREIMAYLFYPAEKDIHAKRMPFDQDTLESTKAILSFESGMPLWLFAGLHFLKTNSVENAKLAQNKDRFPIVIVSHGWGPMVQHYTWFCELLASYGFFVVGINYPYVAGITRFPDSRIIRTLVFKWAKEKKLKDGKLRYRARKEQQVGICAQDIGFVISKLKELTQKGSEFWSKKIDVNNVGVLGSSFGGTTSVRACRKDARIKCGINMDGCLRGDDRTSTFETPFMFLLGEKSNQWEGKEGAQDLEEINTLCDAPRTKIYKVTIKDIGHGVFSDAPLHLDVTLFIKLLSKYVDFYSTTVASMKKEGLEAMKPYIIEFFEKHLKGEQSKLLHSDRGEITVDVNEKQGNRK